MRLQEARLARQAKLSSKHRHELTDPWCLVTAERGTLECLRAIDESYRAWRRVGADSGLSHDYLDPGP